LVRKRKISLISMSANACYYQHSRNGRLKVIVHSIITPRMTDFQSQYQNLSDGELLHLWRDRSQLLNSIVAWHAVASGAGLRHAGVCRDVSHAVLWFWHVPLSIMATFAQSRWKRITVEKSPFSLVTHCMQNVLVRPSTIVNPQPPATNPPPSARMANLIDMRRTLIAWSIRLSGL